MPFPFLFAPVAAITTKTLAEIAAAAAVATLASDATRDLYQEIKKRSSSQDDRKQSDDRNV